MARDTQHHMTIQLGDDEDGVPIGSVEVDYFGDELIYLEVVDDSGASIGNDSIHATVTLPAAAARAIASDLLIAAERLEQRTAEVIA